MIKAKTSPSGQVRLLNSKQRLVKRVWEYREMYMFLFLGLTWTLIFSYLPMYGLLMAFQDAKLGTIIGQAEWVGLHHFDKFINGLWFEDVVRNTLVYGLAGTFLYWPAALALALLLHNSTNPALKKLTQNLTYVPHMLSLIVVFAIVNLFIDHNSGLINVLITKITGEPSRINFYLIDEALVPIYLIAGLWQNTGYSAIIYIGALSSVDEETVEAARIDGASKWRIIWNIQIPTIMPTIVTMLVMNSASVFAVGTEKMLLMQNDLNLDKTEVIGTYVYKLTTGEARYGFTTAISVLQNVINLSMMFIVNWLGDKVSGISVI